MGTRITLKEKRSSRHKLEHGNYERDSEDFFLPQAFETGFQPMEN